MSAYWKLKGISSELGEIEACWTASRAPSVVIRFTEKGAADDAERAFQSLSEADDWASKNGVAFWEAIETVRAFPFAEKLPIVFSDAPPANVLENAIKKFTSGEKLGGIASEISVDAGLLRYWLVGAEPTNENLRGLKQRKRFSY